MAHTKMALNQKTTTGKTEPPLEPPRSTQAKTGLEFLRFFADGKVSPLDAVAWERRTAQISNEKGQTIFRQENVEVPKTWSQTATNIVASKYFHGKLNTPERESSVRQLIGRVVDTIVAWGEQGGYFASSTDRETFRDDLTHLLVEQKMSFNSPVWFNVGVQPKAQCSACFINSVQDDMESIMNLTKTEGMLFKWGSGTGTNFSSLRGSREALSGGGIASGPVSFMKGFDAFAGVIKSGGKTRRAAKMVILNVDHPDIVEFIDCKMKEERKAHVLVEQGYDPAIDGEAYTSIFFQNANHSVRVTDEFMQAVEEDRDWWTRNVTDGTPAGKYPARELLHRMAESAWHCGDPGMPYDSDAGRDMCGAVTALMCGEAYAQSARIAERLEPFPGFALNREPMLDVIRMHREALRPIEPDSVPPSLLAAAEEAWNTALKLGEKFGYRNSQVTVLAPTGTIGFMMDCDTTGIEPDLALVKHKKLVGGGVIKIVNHTVPQALLRLGYTPDDAEQIVSYIDRTGTIEGAPALKPEHLPVFDCSLAPADDGRSIAWQGHLRMLAAAQPFISGAISKTINMPEESTIEHIMQAYMEAWKLGLKAVAIYRDNSKRSQPLSAAGAKKEETKQTPQPDRKSTRLNS